MLVQLAGRHLIESMKKDQKGISQEKWTAE